MDNPGGTCRVCGEWSEIILDGVCSDSCMEADPCCCQWGCDCRIDPETGKCKVCTLKFQRQLNNCE